jgi:hypothetical protein
VQDRGTLGIGERVGIALARGHAGATIDETKPD